MSILLNSSEILQVVLNAAPATNQLHCNASWADQGDLGGDLSLLTNGTTAVTLVASPASGVARVVSGISVFNADTATRIVTVTRKNGSDSFVLAKVQLLTGYQLEYSNGGGWKVIDTNGAIVQSGTAAAGMTNPMTTLGDVIVGAGSGTPTRLGLGANGTFLGVSGGVLGYYAPPGSAWGTLTGTLSAQTDLQAALDAKQARAPNVQTTASAATVTPTFLNDLVTITAQAANLTLANPTGTAINGLGIVIRIKDNGTARTITYGSQYRAIGVTLPTTTVIGKTLYLAMIYNSTDTKWDVLAVGQEA